MSLLILCLLVVWLGITLAGYIQVARCPITDPEVKVQLLLVIVVALGFIGIIAK